MKPLICMTLIIVFTGAALNDGPALAQQPRRERARRLRDSVVEHRDLEYASINGKPLLLDLYLPKGVKNPPLLVWIHGGGWRNGDKGRGGKLMPIGTAAGYACASINYRLSGEAIFPAQIHDCKAAIRWLRAHAATYGYDAQRIGAGGSSAGGHLVALLGTSGGDKGLEGKVGTHLDQSSSVQAVCDMYGPTDFLQMDAHALPDARFKHNDARSPESLLIGGPILENKDKVAKVNPITYIDQQDPPFLIIHGSKDPLVPLHQSQLLNEALKRNKVPVTLRVLEGAKHGGREFNAPDVNGQIVTFFDKHLKQQEKQSQ
ncbi:alpha/beta hydrolase [Gimesia fumaroli]|uniref:Carboxylesterase NlhH n=1 Tax=Gimesia fumaroli TaxID=2527976 RepID=A0A518IJR4_9PLAN|nr:alpha/beta hydrolase [Gimesia fumaroli]QDV53343.1 Carboxylesterase NlhH [Gimesia fumaroli]